MLSFHWAWMPAACTPVGSSFVFCSVDASALSVTRLGRFGSDAACLRQSCCAGCHDRWAFVISNLQGSGEPHYFTPVIGEYDKWAIKYGYMEVEDEKLLEEHEVCSIALSCPRWAVSAVSVWCGGHDDFVVVVPAGFRSGTDTAKACAAL